MGTMTFFTAPYRLADWAGLEQSYMTGYDGRVFPTQIAVAAQPDDDTVELSVRATGEEDTAVSKGDDRPIADGVADQGADRVASGVSDPDSLLLGDGDADGIDPGDTVDLVAVDEAILQRRIEAEQSGRVESDTRLEERTQLRPPGNGRLYCRRPVSDSGKLRVVWPVDGIGYRLLSTSSLREQAEPYLLSLELARGLVGDLRTQAANWKMGGMMLPAAFLEAESEAFSLFAAAACRQDDLIEAGRLADRALAAGCRASDELMRAYTLQKLAVHRSRGQTIPAVLGCGVRSLPDAPLTERFTKAFSATALPMDWRAIEPRENDLDWSLTDRLVDWGQASDLLMKTGPLLDFREGGLPEWVHQWSVDQSNLLSFLCDFVECAKARYRSRVKFWSLAIGACTGGAFGLTEEQRLTLVARLLEAARGSDDDSQVFLEIDEPWGEYQSAGHHRIAPLQFVDAIARSNLGLEGLVLRLDLTADGGLARYRLLADTSRLVDQWSLFGLPLHIRLIVPTDQIDAPHWLSDQLPLLMAKPAVTAVFWSRYQDTATLSTGAITVSGEAKPTHTVFANHHRQNR